MNSTDDPFAGPLHGTARALLELVPATEPVDKARIPIREYNRYFVGLKKRQRDDGVLFAHLAVLTVRLRDVGFLAAAEQMLNLARIGLTETELELAVKEAERGRDASRRISGKPTAGRQEGLAAPVPGGFGLRRR